MLGPVCPDPPLWKPLSLLCLTRGLWVHGVALLFPEAQSPPDAASDPRRPSIPWTYDKEKYYVVSSGHNPSERNISLDLILLSDSQGCPLS